MTEIQETADSPLPESVRRFVAHWGSMGIARLLGRGNSDAKRRASG